MFNDPVVGLLMICAILLGIITERLRDILIALNAANTQLNSTRKIIASLTMMISSYTQLRIGETIATKRGDAKQETPF
jgi:hypothetical protein